MGGGGGGGADITRKRTTAKLKFSKVKDFVRQIVYVWVIDPAESKSVLIF